MFGNIEVGEYKFDQHKSPISIYDVKVHKIVLSNKVHFNEKSFKYFIGYKNGKKVM